MLNSTLGIKREKAKPLPEKNEIFNLGVIISDYAKVDDQNKKSAANGRGRAGWICRVLNTRGKYEMFILYKTLVLPLLGY